MHRPTVYSTTTPGKNRKKRGRIRANSIEEILVLTCVRIVMRTEIASSGRLQDTGNNVESAPLGDHTIVCRSFCKTPASRQKAEKTYRNLYFRQYSEIRGCVADRFFLVFFEL